MSPTVFRHNAYRLFFFSNEGSPLEPIHIHVRKGDALAKFWIEPGVSVAESFGFNSKELREIEEVVKKNEQKIRDEWNKYFSE